MTRLFALLSALLLSACAIQAPPYQPSIPNVQKLGAAQPLKLGEFTVADPKLNAIGLRGSQMSSAVGGTYGGYLKEALNKELALAKKLDPASQTELSGELLENDIDASGFSTATGKIKAQFVVKKNNQEAFRKQISAESTWDSSFAGAVAIPAAVNNYPLLVQKLLSALFDDQDFVAASK